MSAEVGKEGAQNEQTSCDPEATTTSDVKGDEAKDVNSTGEDEKENGIEEKTEEAELPTKNIDLTVFVGKLSDRVTPEELKKFFTEQTKSEETEVLGVNMPCSVVKKTKKLGIAFVDFANKRAYEVALTLNNSSFLGQNILVLPASKTHQGLLLMDGPEGEAKEGTEGEETKAKAIYVPVYKKSDHVVYIKNLPNGVCEDEVLAFFKFTRADIVDIAIPTPFKAKRNAKRPVRAIIAFPDAEMFEKCMAMTKTTFGDREVIVEKHQMVSKGPAGEKRSATDAKDGSVEGASPEKQPRIAGEEPSGQMELDLFVKHIPKEVSDRQIKEFFAAVAATVLKVNLFSESVTGSTRGMGFVSMADKESVQKGLMLDNKRFYKNKIRISVRRDREHLDRPNKGEVEPNFSTFIGNLPIKETAESLKNALKKHFEAAECSVKNIFIPLAVNRSGNKGYAFVEFENEDSLKKAQSANNTEITLAKTKISLVVTDRWPENPTDSTGGDKSKENNAQRGTISSLFDAPGLNKLRKRKKGFPFPGESLGPFGPHAPFGPQGPFGPNGPPGPMGHGGPGDDMGPHNRWNCPPEFQSDGPEYGPYGSEYQDYLDYLEYRDYVAMRKAYDDRREMAEYRARYEEHDDDFGPPPPPPPPPMQPPPPPSAQGPMESDGYSRRGGPRNEGNLDDGYRGSSAYNSNGQRDRGSYDDVPPGPASFAGSRSRDFREFEYADSHGGPGDGFKNTGPGNTGSGGYGGGSGGNSSFLSSDQRGSGGYNYSDSFSSSLNSSRYQTAADSTFSRSHLLDTSGGSSSALGFSRDGNTTYRDSTNGVDSSNRGGGLSKYSSSYQQGGGGDIRSSHSSASGATGSSTMRAGLDSGRSQYGLMSYSGMDRASSYSGGRGDSSGYGGSTGGSYSGADASQRYSYSNSSGQGDRHHFSGYSVDLFDQYRKGSQYDKLNSNVSRLGPSGSGSNMGYDGYSGPSGFRDV